MPKLFIFAILSSAIFFNNAKCQTSAQPNRVGTVKDERDGRVYKTVKIGEQVWMAENLNTITLVNGDPIIEAKTNKEWLYLWDKNIPAWCYYDNLPENGGKYGRLYNIWTTVHSKFKVCPAGWKVPTDADWEKLRFFISGVATEDSFFLYQESLKSTHGWPPEGKGTNISGFNAIPGGYRFVLSSDNKKDEDANEDEFIGKYNFTKFWGSSSVAEYLPSENGKIPHYYWSEGMPDETWSGIYIRCIKE